MDSDPKAERTTFSSEIIKKLKMIKENANRLDGNINRLTGSYFGMVNDGKGEDVVQPGDDFSSVLHSELDDINSSIMTALDFVTRL